MTRLASDGGANSTDGTNMGGDGFAFWDVGGGGEGGVCAATNVQLAAQTPTVTLLVDQSWSMQDSNFGGMTRWKAVYETLMDSRTGIVKRLQSSVIFGLTLYTSDHGNRKGTVCPILTEVPAKLNNWGAIDAVYSKEEPIDDTPTGEAIEQLTRRLASQPHSGASIIVLATDGEPDTCADPQPDRDDLTEAQIRAKELEANQRAIAAAQAAYAKGFPMFIISVGSDIGAAHLQDMANAGAGLPIGGAKKAPYYMGLAPGDLVKHFNTIIGGVRTCKFTLKGKVQMDRASEGRVTVDQTVLAYNTQWKLQDASTLEILGQPCQQILSGTAKTVAATFPCGSVIIVK